VIRAAALLALLLVALGCKAPAVHGAPAAGASADEPVPSALPSRPEVVAAADTIAVSGSRKGGPEGAALTMRAADLRRRIWRLERREADALEAIELLRSAERTLWPGACDAALSRALLEGELRADPSETYRSVYRVRVAREEPACRKRAEHVLATLGAFKPLPTVLSEIERELGKSTPDLAHKPASGTVRTDPDGAIVVPTLAAGRARGPVRITSVERYGAKDSARVVVFMTEPTTFDVGFIPRESAARGPRLYVDIERASYKGKRELEVGGLVQRVRLGKQSSGTRVVLDLDQTVYRRVFYLPEPFRLVIDVSNEPPAPAPALSTGPRSVKRLVLDPGHGGHDPGAIGPGGLREKDVTLDIAHRAAPLIARELGVATLLTRDSDDFVPLDERAARANAFQADLFISIHCNASEDGASRGVMTFVLDESRDQLALRIAARENAASPAAAAELANVMSRSMDAGTAARSLRFAELLQRAAVASLAPGYPDEPDQGVKRAGFYVLAGAQMPAALFEGSFISNPLGEARLNSADYRQKLADSIVNAVRAYRDGR
jgi:N-acetylmuramoyl-L-alanine amidase